MAPVIPQIAAAPASTGYGLDLSTIGIGLVLLPTGVASLLGGLAAGRAVARLGPRALVAGGAALGSPATHSSRWPRPRPRRSRSAAPRSA
jgi:hypothetical protein